MPDPLLVETRDGVLVMTMNRPERRNAVDAALSHALAEAFTRLERDPNLRVAVLTGAGGSFCSGMDLKAHADGESVEVPGRGLGGLTRRPPTKPVLAAVEGHAVAGGMELVLACDVVVAAEDAVLGLPEVHRGLVAGSGGLIRLAQRVPHGVAAEMVLTGRTISASEAERWGLVTRTVPTGRSLDTAIDLAAEIGHASPVAVAASRQILQAAGTPQAWQVQDAVLADVLDSDDAREGALAFVQKRQPRWTGT